ncbi:MAG: DUF2059 domain-containing protein [Rhodospirillaceae bacterium]|nr:DUF2059 domain-containing protein [Rhodospirillaceae bacterium]MBT4042252.1 DUF2059 domain-containing protein [Rhodospirillaceae bacterium]MBT4687375.1 DUF2059 domain-containing protein [Rhodospirillaceae bacterium]MBT5079574.1 DUF2059 domain-containing protein [Rhodospirillaceae bacterium]MBT5523842.1 DUF2059 domain-containing protein [Rhodospirillaceae bacterium]
MHRFASVIISLCCLLFVLPAQAGPSNRDNIRQLIEMDGAITVADGVIDKQRPVVRKSFLAAYPGVSNKIADAYVDAFAAELTARKGQFLDLIIDVYAKIFTAEEITALLAFHASPLGQKARNAAPSILMGGRQAGVDWGQKNGAAVAAAAMARLKAMGYEVK